MDKLNEKLLEFAGFKHFTDKLIVGFRGISYENGWIYPDGYAHLDPPNFTKSLDACFKWLMPKLTKEYIELEIHCDYLVKSDSWNVALLAGFYYPGEPKHLISVANSKDIALAFCLAIEKLIDEGNDD